MKALSLKILFLLVLPLSLFSQAPQIIPAEHPGLVGLWEYEDAGNLVLATHGNDLVLTGSHTPISGPTVDDDAIRIDVGSYYTCTHDIPANGGGSDVNEYSLVFDFKIADNTEYHCLFQANESNGNDGEIFINPTGNIGRTTAGPGYSGYQINVDEWYRVVISIDLGNTFRIYLDGILVLDGDPLSVDNSYGLYAAAEENLVHFFADNDGEDNEIDIALAAIFNHPLGQAEVTTLGGFGHTIAPVLTGVLPYLQTPTPTSIYVSWHSTETSSTSVEYGTSDALGSSTNGTVEDISGKKWHTVFLTGLMPNTEYFYKCVSNTAESEIYKFKTPAAEQSEAHHLRFILFGDNRTDVAKSTEIANKAKQKAIEMYGADLQNHINLIINVGDIVTSGSSISQYENEYFRPYACLSSAIPSMVIIGNHESESQNFYDYMKYEDNSDFTGALEERFYDFVYLDNQFVFINGNSALQSGTQTSWLDGILTESDANDDIDMIYCFTHQPGHSELWPDGCTEYIQEDIIPVLREHDKVQLFAYGHSHNYERGTVESLAAESNGDFYIVLSGGAGGGLDRWGMYSGQTDYEELMISLDHYLYNIVDIDLDNNTMEMYTFSFGNSDKPLDNELVDYFYRKLDQAKPDKPVAILPNIESENLPLLVASEYAGVDSLMSSKFQITSTPGDYSNPVVEKRQDWTNIFGDSGAPNYFPTDLNDGINLCRLQIETSLSLGDYAWRVCYRDHNQKWSEWSEEQTFTVVSSLTPYTDFSANITAGEAPLSVEFTDLSYPVATTWAWDFDNDSSDESNEQNPEFIYNFPGFYSVKLITDNGTEIKDLYIDVEDNSVQIIENKGNDILRINPNPCMEKANIEFYLKENGNAKISILDNNGKIVKIINNTNLQKGKHNIAWNLDSENGNKVSDGKYFVKFETKGISEVKKLVVIQK